VDALLLGLAALLLQEAVEALDLGEEARVAEVRVQDADRVVRITRGQQLTASVGNGLEMPGCDEPTDPDDGELLLHR
jgi:hypothetical protein